MIIKITHKRRKLLEYLDKFIKDNGYSPSFSEIQQELGISSKSVLHYDIKRLEEAGLINRVDNMIRGITSINLPESNSVLSLYPQRDTPKLSSKRSKYNKKGRKSINPNKRVSAMEFFGGCAYCGTKVPPIELDHFYPVYLGGSDNPNNLIPACTKCNRQKSASDPVNWVLKTFGADILSKIISYIGKI